MSCDRCDAQVPEGANFCPACGAPVGAPADSPGKAGRDQTTDSIEVGLLDPSHDVGELPQLEPGTGMLVVVRGPNAGSRFLLDREVTVVGRHPDADIFLDDVTVSRRHVELRRELGELHLVDLGSLNGTYVGGERVDERSLHSGDEVQIGRFKLLYVAGGHLDGVAGSHR